MAIAIITSAAQPIGKTALSPNLTITPAGGAQKVHYMVALLTSEALNVLVLLDDEKDAKATKNDLVKSKLIRDQNVLFVSEAFPNPASKEVDIEDLLNPAVYEALVCESYAKELKGKKLVLNDQLPRIARRVEAAFEGLGIAFHKTRPTRLFLKKMASDPASVMDADSIARFERLLGEVNARFKKHVAREDKPFS